MEELHGPWNVLDAPRRCGQCGDVVSSGWALTKRAKEERQIDGVVHYRLAIVDPSMRGSPRILTARRVHGNALRSLTAAIFTELLP